MRGGGKCRVVSGVRQWQREEMSGMEERGSGVDEGWRAHVFDSAVKSFEPANRPQTELGSGARTKVNAARLTRRARAKDGLQLFALGSTILENSVLCGTYRR
jgi:hypothetical protein